MSVYDEPLSSVRRRWSRIITASAALAVVAGVALQGVPAASAAGATRTIGFWRTHLDFMRKVLDQRPLPAAAVVGTSPLGVRPADDSFINGYLKLSKTGTLFQLRSVKVNAIKSIGALLDAYNNSGDNTTIVIPGDIPIGKASPQAAQALARLVAGDC